MSKHFTIIDGYNLLHVNGFLDSRKVGPGTLEKARSLLLGILAKRMDAASRQRTTVVFDSCEAELPNRAIVNDVLVEFANQHDSADELIAIMIAKHSAPKQLTVVSSDHQIQKAAITRGAAAIDSDDWLEQLGETLDRDPDAVRNTSHFDKPKNEDMPGPEFWKTEFGIDEVAANLEEDLQNQDRSQSRQGDGKQTRPPRATDSLPEETLDDEIFPAGYTDDLFDDE